MNRTLRESVAGAGRNPLNHRRAPNSKDLSDDNLDLFSKSRRSLSVASSDESDVSAKLGKLSIGSSKPGRSQLDDLLSSAEGEKHDYDWLLTPPGTPLVPSDGNESQSGHTAPRIGPLVRSRSTAKASRLSVSHSENIHPTRPARSSSVTRPSVSGSQYSTYSNKNILNTSSASVSSYIRPSTPTNRSSSISRPSTPSSRPSLSISSTPSKPRPALSTSSIDNKPRPSLNSRPSTPTSRQQISANLTSPAARTTSRPSTPTRRNSTPSLSPVSRSLTPGGRSLTNGRPVASVSRPSSPGPKVRTPPQPITLHGFPLDTPPNLRTTLPDRPISAGRSRPGVALTAKGNNTDHIVNSASAARRHSLPVVTRGRPVEQNGRARTVSNRSLAVAVDSGKETSTRKPAKASTDNTGFGWTISKKSLDMAIRHMDIRNGSNGLRPLNGSNLFPQSIRSSSQKVHPGPASSNSINSNGAYAEKGNQYSENGSEEDRHQPCAKLTSIDIYESSRYDMILLKEDMKNANWLHSLDDKCEQGVVFDNGFGPLPEPFDPL